MKDHLSDIFTLLTKTLERVYILLGYSSLKCLLTLRFILLKGILFLIILSSVISI